MLIRSQDRKTLVPLGELNVRDTSIFQYSDAKFITELGRYNSQARCLEILDEIQNEYLYSNHYSGSGINSSECQNWLYGVYEMPEK